jgi:adenosylhomocysteinase
MDDLPALRSLIINYVPSVRKPRLLLITHLLPTAKTYIDLLAKVFDVNLIGIPYSSSEANINILKAAGYDVIVPQQVSQIPKVALEIVRKLSKSEESLVVQEIGGYLADYATELCECRGFLGVVEDTNNGHWRYAEKEENLRYPVVSIARSPIKAIEDSQIGDAVIYSVERILRERLHAVIKGTKALVLGFGKIGTSCADALQRRGAHTAVFDTDLIKIMRARTEGFAVGSLRSLLSEADIIVGATGHCSIDASTFKLVKDGAVIASASSKQVEFDLKYIKESYSFENIGIDISRFYRGDHTFFLLSNAYPVNFRDNSILGQVLDAVYSELFLCIREVMERRVSSGLIDSWPELHREVAAAWCGAHLEGYRKTDVIEFDNENYTHTLLAGRSFIG